MTYYLLAFAATLLCGASIWYFTSDGFRRLQTTSRLNSIAQMQKLAAKYEPLLDQVSARARPHIASHLSRAVSSIKHAEEALYRGDLSQFDYHIRYVQHTLAEVRRGLAAGKVTREQEIKAADH